MSIAKACFDAQLAMGSAENRIYEALVAVGITADEYADYSFDYYDESLELSGCNDQLRLGSKEQAAIWAMGFSRVWLNHTDGMETFYSPDYPLGARKKKVR